MRKDKLLFVVATIAILAVSAIAAYAFPDGASINVINTTTKANATPSNHTARGGFVANADISGSTQTRKWQGYFGEISGNLTLENAAAAQMYSWAVTNISGQVYATQDNAIVWTNIAAQNNCTIDEAITGTGRDRVSNTFTNSSNSQFDVGNITIAVNSSCTAYTYVNGAPQSSVFEEVILTDDSGATTGIYTALLENDATGFDGSTHDFQMIVPASPAVAGTVYYFYLELT